jgi:hypothetical protein
MNLVRVSLCVRVAVWPRRAYDRRPTEYARLVGEFLHTHTTAARPQHSAESGAVVAFMQELVFRYAGCIH